MWSTRLRKSVVRAGALVATSAALSVTLVVAAAPTYAAVPKTPKFGASIENLSPYQPQTTCHPTAQKGVLKFRALILATYRDSGDDGIVRACSSGGTSEHKEGRAWDWMVSYKNPHQVAEVKALFAWLFKADSNGNNYAMARRLGIMYIIWNKKIWGSYRANEGWRPYSCSGVTLCHQNHVHFSFSRAGAKGSTSYWTKVVVNVGGTPGNGTSNGGSHTGGSTGGSAGGSTGGSAGNHGGPTGSHGGTDGDDPAWWRDGHSGNGTDTGTTTMRTATVSTLAAPVTVEADDPFIVTGRLTTKSGEPVAGRTAHVFGRLVGDDRWLDVAEVATDSSGRWSAPLQAPASAELVAWFFGSRSFVSSHSARVTVTVPETPLPDAGATTDPAGSADSYADYDGYRRYDGYR